MSPKVLIPTYFVVDHDETDLPIMPFQQVKPPISIANAFDFFDLKSWTAGSLETCLGHCGVDFHAPAPQLLTHGIIGPHILDDTVPSGDVRRQIDDLFNGYAVGQRQMMDQGQH